MPLALMTIGDLNGVSKSTISSVVGRVSHHIAMLKDHFIVFPQDFFQIAKFPKVIATRDCTHIKILSPGISY